MNKSSLFEMMVWGMKVKVMTKKIFYYWKNFSLIQKK